MHINDPSRSLQINNWVKKDGVSSAQNASESSKPKIPSTSKKRMSNLRSSMASLSSLMSSRSSTGSGCSSNSPSRKTIRRGALNVSPRAVTIAIKENKKACTKKAVILDIAQTTFFLALPVTGYSAGKLAAFALAGTSLAPAVPYLIPIGIAAGTALSAHKLRKYYKAHKDVNRELQSGNFTDNSFRQLSPTQQRHASSFMGINPTASGKRKASNLMSKLASGSTISPVSTHTTFNPIGPIRE